MKSLCRMVQAALSFLAVDAFLVVKFTLPLPYIAIERRTNISWEIESSDPSRISSYQESTRPGSNSYGQFTGLALPLKRARYYEGFPLLSWEHSFSWSFYIWRLTCACDSDHQVLFSHWHVVLFVDGVIGPFATSYHILLSGSGYIHSEYHHFMTRWVISQISSFKTNAEAKTLKGSTSYGSGSSVLGWKEEFFTRYSLIGNPFSFPLHVT